MPRLIECKDGGSASLGEVSDALVEGGFDPACDASLAATALLLRRLGNDQRFLGDILLAQLKGQHRSASFESAYGPQSLVLSDPARGAFLRANIWPSETDHIHRASGAHSFAYGLAHDHNFDFLTLGYFGPGYASDYWEYDGQAVTGLPGEAVSLRYTGRRTLDPGAILHYRAHADVHRQHAPASLSVTLNVMACDPAMGWRPQYAFDPEQGRIAAVLNPNATEVFLRLAVGLGGGEALDLAERWGRSHPSDRLRLACFEARASTMDETTADALWREAELSGSRLLAMAAKQRRLALG